jgi:4-carboxymuconolactone decarboxylase
MKAGLDAKVADELALGKRPSAMSDDEAAVYEFCIQLHRTRNVDDATFNRALALFKIAGESAEPITRGVNQVFKKAS